MGKPPSPQLPALSPTLPLAAGQLTTAATDEEFMRLWLRRPNLSRDTVRNSAKEAGRFLLWCRVAGLTLDMVRFEHLLAYSEFLADPQPAEHWISPAKYRRTDTRWRPFLAPLTQRSQLQALVTIKGFFSWAHEARHIQQNPAKLLGRLAPDIPESITRFLPLRAMPYLMVAADQLPTDRPTRLLRQARARFLMVAYYSTAVRLSELVNASMNSFRPDKQGNWWLHVVGKGRRAGRVPVPPALLDELGRYRRSFGLPALPAYDDALPLLLATRGQMRKASTSAIARSIKQLMTAAGKLAGEAGEGELAARLAAASTHWLRHSQLTHQVDAGVPLKTVQLNARHANISTTSIYVHKEDDVRHAETVAAASTWR